MNIRLTVKQNAIHIGGTNVSEFDGNANPGTGDGLKQQEVVDSFESVSQSSILGFEQSAPVPNSMGQGISVAELLQQRIYVAKAENKPVEQSAEKVKQFAAYLGEEFKKSGIDIDPTVLTTLSTTVAKGGNTGLFTALGIAYGTTKLAVGPPASEGVVELLTSLAENPDQAEELVMPMITDPDFFPITSEQLQVISALSTMPFGQSQQAVASFVLHNIDQHFTPESVLPDLEAYRRQEQALVKFTEITPKVFELFGSQKASDSPLFDFLASKE